MRGSIYGVVTVSDTAEPMRATGVELYKDKSGVLLLKTVTYDDGSFEFEDLQPGYYVLKVDADGYESLKYNIEVEAGRTARADMRLTKLNTYMTVKTESVTARNNGTAMFVGSYDYRNYSYSPDEWGFVYGQDPNLTMKNGRVVKTDSKMQVEVSGLKIGKWYVMAYAKNSIGYAFGTVVPFEISGDPEVATLAVTNVSETTATLNGRITFDGDPHYTEKGFVYSSSFSNPTVDDPASATTKVVVSGTSSDFSANIADLTSGKKYYVRAYVKGVNQVVYGNTVSFVADASKPYVVLDNLAIQLTDLSKGASWTAADQMCKQSSVGGFNDWRLPTLGELKFMYNNRSKIGGFENGWYWSSTSYGSRYYNVSFGNGDVESDYSNLTLCVRAVRTVN